MTQQFLDIVSRSTERKLNRELINRWHTARDQEFCMYFGRNRTRHPAQPIAKQNVPDARRVQPKAFPCPYFIIKGGGFTYQSSFFIENQI